MAEAPTLYLCGLGHSPRRTATLNVLHALDGCDVLLPYGRPEVAEVLAEFCPEARRLPLFPAKARAALLDRAFRELAAGRSVGVATAGHPLVFGGFSEAVRRCAREGYACETFGAISALDVALARLGKTLGIDWSGVQAYGAEAVPGARLSPDQPLVVVVPEAGLAAPAAGRLSRALSKLYPPEHEALVLSPDPQAKPRSCEVSRLALDLGTLTPDQILFVPAR